MKFGPKTLNVGPKKTPRTVLDSYLVTFGQFWNGKNCFFERNLLGPRKRLKSIGNFALDSFTESEIQ